MLSSVLRDHDILHLLLHSHKDLDNLMQQQTSLDSISKPQQTDIYFIPAIFSHAIALCPHHANLFRPFIINPPDGLIMLITCHIQCQTQTPKHSSALLNHTSRNGYFLVLIQRLDSHQNLLQKPLQKTANLSAHSNGFSLVIMVNLFADMRQLIHQFS